LTGKPVVPRASAVRDVDEAIDHYLSTGDAQAALGFIDELQRAYRHIAQYPASGSSRYAVDLNVPELRSWILWRYPYVVFCLEHDGHINVWRVLQGRRDIAAWVRE
jgi:toxin ParE1/3/4